LFGYVKGSHNTAWRDKDGLWKIADGGTLFLDEIGDLALDHQVKVLRALEEKKIRPVGATREIPADARIIAATNRDLFTMVQMGQFREDLYYRLRAFTIHMPALRDHPEDIAPLARHFRKNITLDEANELSPEIFSELKSYRWPGNARELKMVLKKSL
jgi:two-component system response regulator PilR (NtrC family)